MSDLGSQYIDEVFRSLRGHKRLADTAIQQLSDEQFFALIDPDSNSVAIIVKHVAGNLRSRFSDFLTSDGEKRDRDRDREFMTTAETDRAALLQWWEENWQLLFETINSLQATDLELTVTIRGQPHSVLQALNRAIAHLSYHMGQIVLLAKHWKGPEWKTLSVPKGKSEEHNREMFEKYRNQKSQANPD
jgi:hypothetical protein